MVFRRPDPSFVLVTALVACLVAALTVLLAHLALKGGAFEPTYSQPDRLACKSPRVVGGSPGRPSTCG